MTSAVRKTVSSLSFRASAEPSTSFDPPDDTVRKNSSPEPAIVSGLITSTKAMTSRSDSSAGSFSVQPLKADLERDVADDRYRQRGGGVDRVVGWIGEIDVRCELVVERGCRVELLHVVPAETGAGKAPVLFRIGLFLFTIGEADAVARGETPRLCVHPLVPDTGMHDVPVQDPGVVIAVPAPACVPEECRGDVPFVASADRGTSQHPASGQAG